MQSIADRARCPVRLGSEAAQSMNVGSGERQPAFEFPDWVNKTNLGRAKLLSAWLILRLDDDAVFGMVPNPRRAAIRAAMPSRQR
jgi:hypothetical protein